MAKIYSSGNKKKLILFSPILFIDLFGLKAQSCKDLTNFKKAASDFIIF